MNTQEIKRPDNNLIKVLKKNPRFRIFFKCCEKYNLSHLFYKKNITIFIPVNICFFRRINYLDKKGDEYIKNLIMAHFVPFKINHLEINKHYPTLYKNKGIKLTGEKKIGKIDIQNNPKVLDNSVIYRISDMILI